LANLKYVFITSGVSSSQGKGIIPSSLAQLLQAIEYSVIVRKLDPGVLIEAARQTNDVTMGRNLSNWN